MIDGQDDEDAEEEARQHPAGGGSAPQAPGSGHGRGKERDEAGVGDEIPAGVDPLVADAGRVEPGFIGKARFCRVVTHTRSVEATWFSEATYLSPDRLLSVRLAAMRIAAGCRE
jgi:hypothetical protein